MSDSLDLEVAQSLLNDAGMVFDGSDSPSKMSKSASPRKGSPRGVDSKKEKKGFFRRLGIGRGASKKDIHKSPYEQLPAHNPVPLTGTDDSGSESHGNHADTREHAPYDPEVDSESPGSHRVIMVIDAIGDEHSLPSVGMVQVPGRAEDIDTINGDDEEDDGPVDVDGHDSTTPRATNQSGLFDTIDVSPSKESYDSRLGISPHPYEKEVDPDLGAGLEKGMGAELPMDPETPIHSEDIDDARSLLSTSQTESLIEDLASIVGGSVSHKSTGSNAGSIRSVSMPRNTSLESLDQQASVVSNLASPESVRSLTMLPSTGSMVPLPSTDFMPGTEDAASKSADEEIQPKAPENNESFLGEPPKQSYSEDSSAFDEDRFMPLAVAGSDASNVEDIIADLEPKTSALTVGSLQSLPLNAANVVDGLETKKSAEGSLQSVSTNQSSLDSLRLGMSTSMGDASLPISAGSVVDNLQGENGEKQSPPSNGAAGDELHDASYSIGEDYGYSKEMDYTYSKDAPLLSMSSSLRDSSTPSKQQSKAKPSDTDLTDFVSEIESGKTLEPEHLRSPPRVRNRYQDNTPTSVREARDVFTAANSPKESPREKKSFSVGSTTPVSERRAAFMASSGTPNSRGSNQDDPAIMAASSTSISARRAALASGSPRPPKARDEALTAASSTPVNERRAALQMETNNLMMPLPPKSNDEALKAASSTPVNERRAALKIDTKSSYAPLPPRDSASFYRSSPRSSPSGDHRTTIDVADFSSPRESSSADVERLRSSSPSIEARKAALAAERMIEKDSPSKAGFFSGSSSPSVAERKASLKAERMSPRSSPSSEAASFLASTTSLQERRAILESVTSSSPRSPAMFEKDRAMLASSSPAVKDRQAAYAKYTAQESSLKSAEAIKAELEALKEQSLVSSRRRTLRNRRARADRLFFQLCQKRGGMTDKDFLRVDDFLPRERVIMELKASLDSYDGPVLSFDSKPVIDTAMNLRIWLTCPEEKTFEIVCLDMTEDMTVEEVIEEACNHALDPVLCEQHYVSLCNKKAELVEPTKSVIPLLNLSPEKKYYTLMAVPFGSSAPMIRAIRRVLEKTEQMKRWLKSKDPFIASNESIEGRSLTNDSIDRKVSL